LGIGNNPGQNPDWTFAQNATNFLSKKLQVYVLPKRTLTMNTVGSGGAVNIRIGPRDLNGAGNGATPLTRVYNVGTEISIAAATMANGNTFLKWQRDGVDFSNSPRLTITWDDNHAFTAFYVPTRTLTVNSSNPGSGVNIRLAPSDNNGLSDGLTGLTRLYGDGKVVSLAAALKSGANSFIKWQKDGVDYSTNYRINLTMHGNYALTAIYGP
jgi:hypothetical protein